MECKYTEQEESEIVELFMLNEDDRDERLKAHYRQGKIVDGKWVNDEEVENELVECDFCGEYEDPDEIINGSRGSACGTCRHLCDDDCGVVLKPEEESDSDEEEEPYCFKDTTIDTVENDICFCSVGGCVKPTEFD